MLVLLPLVKVTRSNCTSFQVMQKFWIFDTPGGGDVPTHIDGGSGA
jgi:hypothetical protein